MEVHDFLLGDDLDLSIEDGDFAFGESTEEHQRDIMLATKGSFRQVPEVGVAIIEQLLNDASTDDLCRIIQKEMEGDGMNVKRLRVNEDGTVELIATYGRR